MSTRRISTQKILLGAAIGATSLLGLIGCTSTSSILDEERTAKDSIPAELDVQTVDRETSHLLAESDGITFYAAVGLDNAGTCLVLVRENELLGEGCGQRAGFTFSTDGIAARFSDEGFGETPSGWRKASENLLIRE